MHSAEGVHSIENAPIVGYSDDEDEEDMKD